MALCNYADEPVMSSTRLMSHACSSKGSGILRENLISTQIPDIGNWTISESLPFQSLPLETHPIDAGFLVSLKDTLLDG